MLAGTDKGGTIGVLYIGTEKETASSNMKTSTLLKCGAAAMLLALINAGTCLAEDMTIAPARSCAETVSLSP